MTRSFECFDELRGLLEALCEESITAEQMTRLEELVLGHPEAEAFYVQYLGLQADLVGQFTVPPATFGVSAGQRREAELVPLASAPPARRTGRRTRALLWGAVGLSGLAAGVLLGLTLWQAPPPGASSVPKQQEAIDYTVAVLVQAPGAVWQDTHLPTRAGATLTPGVLRLKSGFAQIEFYSGAIVILQGPAEFKLVSRMEAYCAYGKLRATVPPHAKGFKIGSPKLDLIDQGTEFGLEVVAGGKTEVQVFKGIVELYDAGSDRNAKSHPPITTGEGICLEGTGPNQLTKLNQLNSAGFPTAQDLAAQAVAETKQRQSEWLKASQALRAHPDLLVYYTFETDDPLSRTLLDQARERADPHDGAIVGCSWVTGRWPQKKALQFKQVSDRVRFKIPGTFDSITLMAWVRVDGLPNRNNALMMADGWDPGGLHWQIGDSGTVILGVQNFRGARGGHYHAPELIQPELLGHWIHLAVVYDKAAGKVTHYFDGRPVADVLAEFDVPLTIGDAEIGSWNVAKHRNNTPVRFFSGAMDEFLLFSRALSEEDVLQRYTEGRPPS